MRFLGGWVQFCLFAFVLAEGVASSQESAEPCPTEWNAWMQSGTPESRARTEARGYDYRYDELVTQHFYFYSGVTSLRLGHPKEWENNPAALRKAAQVLLNASAKAMPGIAEGYRYSACRIFAKAAELERGLSVGGSGSTAAPAAPSPNAAPQATLTAQQVRDNEADRELTERATELEARYPTTQPCQWAENPQTQDPCLKTNAESVYIRAIDILAALDGLEDRISPGYYARARASWVGARDAALKGCAHLATSPTPCALRSGAINGEVSTGSGSKASSSGSTAARLPGRIIAGDGKQALDCVSIVQLASSDSAISGGGKVIANQCDGYVTVGWCTVGNNCEKGQGSITNIAPGRSWPVPANDEIRLGACHGADTLRGDPGSKGLYFTCHKPDK